MFYSPCLRFFRDIVACSSGWAYTCYVAKVSFSTTLLQETITCPNGACGDTHILTMKGSFPDMQVNQTAFLQGSMLQLEKHFILLYILYITFDSLEVFHHYFLIYYLSLNKIVVSINARYVSELDVPTSLSLELKTW